MIVPYNKHGFCLPRKSGCITACIDKCKQECVSGCTDNGCIVACGDECDPICVNQCSGYTKRTDNMFYNFLDHIYVSNNMIGNVDIVYNLSDRKFDATNNYYHSFRDMGPPYCDITMGTTEVCVIDTYENLYKKTEGHMWPSDHAMLQSNITYPTSAIMYKEPPFTFHKPTRKKIIITRPDGTVIGGADYKRLYEKYKRKYMNLKKNILKN